MNKNNRKFIKHLKNVFSPDLLKDLRRQLTIFENDKNIFQPQSDREKKAMNRGENPDSVRMQECWYQVWDQGVNSHLRELMTPFELVTYPVQVRHVKAHDHKVPWHQDIGYMRLLGDKAPAQVATCFIPLELAPHKHTTIQFSDMAVEQEYHHSSQGKFGAGLADDCIVNPYHFDLALGDALFFGDLALHRTYTPPGCVTERHSLEFRLIQPQHAVAGKDYFSLKTSRFVTTKDLTQETIDD